MWDTTRESVSMWLNMAGIGLQSRRRADHVGTRGSRPDPAWPVPELPERWDEPPVWSLE
jgi:hypothetical protein